MTHSYTPYKVSAKALFFTQEHKILLLESTTGYFGLPGGTLEQGEEPLEALERELGEELGEVTYSLDPRPIDVCVVVNEYGEQTLQIVFQGRVESVEFVPSQEGKSIRYVEMKEVFTLPLFPTARKILQRYNERGRE